MVSALVHKSEEHHFIFDYTNDIRYPRKAVMSPGEESSPEHRYIRNNDHMLCAFLWLRLLKHELETPDLWGELLTRGEIQQPSESTENNLFTVEEQELLKGKIEEIKALLTKSVRNQQLSDLQTRERIQVIESEIEYIKKASKRLGRVDWKNLAVGSLMSLAIGIGLLPELRPALMKVLQFIVQYVMTGRIDLLE
jgi:hypothetical protein